MSAGGWRPTKTRLRAAIAVIATVVVLSFVLRDPTRGGEPRPVLRAPLPAPEVPPAKEVPLREPPVVLTESPSVPTYETESWSPPSTGTAGGPARPSQLVRAPSNGPARSAVQLTGIEFDATGPALPPTGPLEVDGRPVLPPPRINAPEPEETSGPDERAKADDCAWWADDMDRTILHEAIPMRIDVDTLVLAALRYSPRIKAIKETAAIRRTVIAEEIGAFDWRAFVESRLDDTSEPVGNLLTTGGASRYRDRYAVGEAGIRRRSPTGGEFSVGQEMAYQDNNSDFLVPGQQATTQLAVNFTQPLLRGAGRAYNESRIVVARFETNAAEEDVVLDVQDHLLEVTRTYWELYRARAAFLQRWRQYTKSRTVLRSLEGRRDLDAYRSQVDRARARVANQRAQLVRADATIRNVQTQLWQLVNDPALRDTNDVELLPTAEPVCNPPDFSGLDPTASALENRVEIAAQIDRVEAAGVRLGMAKKDLLPILDLVANTRVDGLAGSTDFGLSYTRQFDRGRPSYSIGLVFEVPLGNRAARARHERRSRELRKAMRELETTVADTSSEAAQAVRSFEAAHRALASQRIAVEAARSEVQHLERRWRLGPVAGGNVSLILEQLLDALDREVAAERAYLDARVDVVLAELELKRATGALVQPTRRHVADVLLENDVHPVDRPVDGAWPGNEALEIPVEPPQRIGGHAGPRSENR